MEKSVISANIKRLRMAKHMTQMELAAVAGISRVALSNIEKGKVAPRVDTLEALCESLNYTKTPYEISYPNFTNLKWICYLAGRFIG